MTSYERHKAWREKNPEHVREYSVAWRKKNRAKIAKQNRKWRANQPIEKKAEANHRRSLKKKFGMTPEDYLDILKKQNGVCACCGFPEKQKDRYGKTRRLSIDHNHLTDNVRALLCSACNVALGFVYEDTSRLAKLIEYVRKHNI